LNCFYSHQGERANTRYSVDFPQLLSKQTIRGMAEDGEKSLTEDSSALQAANINHDINIQRLVTDGRNARGIPTARFIVRGITLHDLSSF
jgi:hypothetical protein